MGLSFCAYNIKRVINILGNKELIKRLKKWASLFLQLYDNIFAFLPENQFVNTKLSLN